MRIVTLCCLVLQGYLKLETETASVIDGERSSLLLVPRLRLSCSASCEMRHVIRALNLSEKLVRKTLSAARLFLFGRLFVQRRRPSRRQLVHVNTLPEAWNDAELTHVCMRVYAAAQGWVHTGDIGQWNPDGSMSIIGALLSVPTARDFEH